MEGNAERLKKAALAAVAKKLKAGAKLTAADYEFLREEEERERAASAKATGDSLASAGSVTPNRGATLDEDLEEWTLRDGIVRGEERKLSGLAAEHGEPLSAVERALWNVQRRLLKRYGFEGARKSGELEGNEALALQLLKTISQLGQVSKEWEHRMEAMRRARSDGKVFEVEEFAALVEASNKLFQRRDGLVMKVRELGLKERKAGAGGKKGAGGVWEIRVGKG